MVQGFSDDDVVVAPTGLLPAPELLTQEEELTAAGSLVERGDPPPLLNEETPIVCSMLLFRW